MVVKTYRGLLADGAQEKIPLSTKDGSVGYRIVKFQVIQASPGAVNAEATVTISKVAFTPLATIDFSNNNILGVAFYGGSASAQAYPNHVVIIFDNEIFNQDIFIGSQDIFGNNEKMNYYIELEQMKLDHTQNMSATLKAIRGSAVD